MNGLSVLKHTRIHLKKNRTRCEDFPVYLYYRTLLLLPVNDVRVRSLYLISTENVVIDPRCFPFFDSLFLNIEVIMETFQQEENLSKRELSFP